MGGNAFLYLKFFMDNGWKRTLSSGLEVDRKMGEYIIKVDMGGRVHETRFRIEVQGIPMMFWCRTGSFTFRNEPWKVIDFIVRWAETEYRRAEAEHNERVVDFVSDS